MASFLPEGRSRAHLPIPNLDALNPRKRDADHRLARSADPRFPLFDRTHRIQHSHGDPCHGRGTIMQPETRILVVDYNSNTRALFRAILAKNGFAVAEAKEGQEALEQIHEFTPNVVLMDIMMPGVAGNELVETIKEWHPEMEVIMITSIDQEEIKQECLEKGAFDLLVKPVTQEQLLSTIHRALEKAA